MHKLVCEAVVVLSRFWGQWGCHLPGGGKLGPCAFFIHRVVLVVAGGKAVVKALTYYLVHM